MFMCFFDDFYRMELYWYFCQAGITSASYMICSLGILYLVPVGTLKFCLSMCSSVSFVIDGSNVNWLQCTQWFLGEISIFVTFYCATLIFTV